MSSTGRAKHSLAFILDEEAAQGGDGGRAMAVAMAVAPSPARMRHPRDSSWPSTASSDEEGVVSHPQQRTRSFSPPVRVPRSPPGSTNPSTTRAVDSSGGSDASCGSGTGTTGMTTGTAGPTDTGLDGRSHAKRRRQRAMTADEKRVARQCSIEGCSNYTINRGLCFRHGGGKACSVDGCDRSAKARGVCWRHGGSVTCTTPGCTRGAKSRGLCWSHGGGTKCSVPDCQKTTISKRLCWTHGGGKRCSFDGCQRPAAESRYNYCTRHHAELSDGKHIVQV